MSRVIETITKYSTDSPCKTAEEMEKVCCVPTAALQCCEKVEPWGGYSQEEVLKKAGISLDEQGRDAQGRIVEVRFEQRSKPCGEKKTKYDTSLGNCCDQVEPIAVDTENSIEIIADNSTGIIYVTGGQIPFRVRVGGVGFYIANTQNPADGFRDAEIFGRTIPIMTLDACGVGLFEIDDGCNVIVVEVRATNGSWFAIPWNESVGSRFQDEEPESYYSGGTSECHTGTVVTAIKTKGRYKFHEYHNYRGAGYSKMYQPASSCGDSYEYLCNESAYGGCGEGSGQSNGEVAASFHKRCVGGKTSGYTRTMMLPKVITGGAFVYPYTPVGGRKDPYIFSTYSDSFQCNNCQWSGGAAMFNAVYYFGCDETPGDLYEWRC